MSIIQGNTNSDQVYTFFDIDGTYIFEDTGHEMFLEAGKTSHEFEETMQKRHLPDRDEPREGRGNELALTLDMMSDEEVRLMAESAQDIEVSYRSGMDALLKGLDDLESPAIAHSAGWDVPIEAVTNGYFDEKIAAKLTENGPELNGRYQKPFRIQNYLMQKGIQDPVSAENARVNFIGDSNTDSEAIRYADSTGGLGIAISDSLDEAMNVEDATIYFGDQTGDHDLAAAVLYHHNTEDLTRTAEFIDQYDLDVSNGYGAPGELSAKNGKEEYVQRLINEVKELE